MISLETRLAVVPSALAESAGRRRFVLDLGSGRYFALAGTAAFVWDRFDGQRSLAQILDELVEEFPVDRRTAEADLLEFARDLLAESLVAPSAGGG